ncbi:unnamed protein product [Peniophora sp. CBMAI 1063]|nr:unnamed protein product [Peniophora sp. CBMAI 1063]
MDTFSRTPSRLGRLKAQMKTVLSRTSSSSGTRPSRLLPAKRHTTPSDRTRVPPRHARTQSEVDPHTYYNTTSTDLDPYSSVHLHPSLHHRSSAHHRSSVRPPRHRSAEHYTGPSPITPDAYALLEDYFPPQRQPQSAPVRPTSASRWPDSAGGSRYASSRPASDQPALSAFARSTPSKRIRPAPTARARSEYARPPTSHPQNNPSHAPSIPTNKTELAAVLSDPYYQHAGVRPPSRPNGARAMPNAAVVPVYVNVYGTGRRTKRGWLGGGRRK